MDSGKDVDVALVDAEADFSLRDIACQWNSAQQIKQSIERRHGEPVDVDELCASLQQWVEDGEVQSGAHKLNGVTVPVFRRVL